jgi:hypothetical protein
LIFDLVNNGIPDYFAVYEMPVQYRSFYMRKLVRNKEKEKHDMEKASGGKEGVSQSKVVKGPGVNRG